MKTRLTIIVVFFVINVSGQAYPGYDIGRTIKPPKNIECQLKGYILSQDDQYLAILYKCQQLVDKSNKIDKNKNKEEQSKEISIISIYNTKKWKKRPKNDITGLEIEWANISLSFFSKDGIYLYVPKNVSNSYYNKSNNYYRINLITEVHDIVSIENDGKQAKFSNGNDRLFTRDNHYSIFGDKNAATLVFVMNDKFVSEIIPDSLKGKPDVDINIPSSFISKDKTYVLIIGNEDYSSKQPSLKKEQNVPFAVNDASIFKEYVLKTFGVPLKQIKFLKNATAAEIRQGLDWLNNLSKTEEGEAEIFFYFSGHGLPDENTHEGYIIPTDVSGNNISQAIKISEIYNKIADGRPKIGVVFLDACFSGGARDMPLLTTKGVKIKPKDEIISGNIIVLTSSSGNESSNVYEEKQHGYFTYYLLKKIKESKGEITLGDLFNYVKKNVIKETSIIGSPQTPDCKTSSDLKNEWQNWKIK